MSVKLGDFGSLLGQIELGGSTLVIITASAADAIVLTDAVVLDPGIRSYSVSNTFVISQAVVSIWKGVQLVSSTIAYSQTVSLNRKITRSFSDALFYVQAASESQIRTASNTIVFNQLTDCQKYKGTGDAVVFTQSLTMNYNPHFELIIINN